jgi:hypothetical protein
MDGEQRDLLTRRLRAAIELQPVIERLRSLLLAIGGVELVAPNGIDSDLDTLISSGSTMEGLVECKIMERSSCHQNVARLWAERKCGLTAIGTGYALSEDGLWRQHSWGVCGSGIVETTKPRTRYFGIVLKGGVADSFARLNLADLTQEHY